MKSGFAGSLVVSANWRGRNLRRGMQASQKRVNNFGKGVRRIVAATALGVGAFAVGKGLSSLLKMSSAGAKAISNWSVAWAKFKQQVARLIAGPAAKIINWLAKGLGLLTDWLARQTSLSGALSNLIQLAKSYLLSIKLIRDAWMAITAGIAAAKMLFKAFIVLGSQLVLKLFRQLINLGNTVFQKLFEWSVKILDIWNQIMQFIANATASIGRTVGQVGNLFGFFASPTDASRQASPSPTDNARSASVSPLDAARQASAGIAAAQSNQMEAAANLPTVINQLTSAVGLLDQTAKRMNGSSVQQGRLQLQAGN
mgnify:CR=1 FL=1